MVLISFSKKFVHTLLHSVEVIKVGSGRKKFLECKLPNKAAML